MVVVVWFNLYLEHYLGLYASGTRSIYLTAVDQRGQFPAAAVSLHSAGKLPDALMVFCARRVRLSLQTTAARLVLNALLSVDVDALVQAAGD